MYTDKLPLNIYSILSLHQTLFFCYFIMPMQDILHTILPVQPMGQAKNEVSSVNDPEEKEELHEEYSKLKDADNAEE
jgi:hypothetical protein